MKVKEEGKRYPYAMFLFKAGETVYIIDPFTGSHPYIPLRKLAVKELYRPFLCVKGSTITSTAIGHLQTPAKVPLAYK